MANAVIMPKQGQSVETCIITELRKKQGDRVSVGDILFTYETDKASFEEEAKFEGIILACFYGEGDEVPVLDNVMVIGEEGEDCSGFLPKKEAERTTEPEPRILTQEGDTLEEIKAGTTEPSGVAVVLEGAPVSPRARNLAAKKGVNTACIAGSGPYGRIIARDVEAAAPVSITGLAKARMAEGGFTAPGQGSGLAGTVKGGDLRQWEAGQSDTGVEGDDFLIKKLSNMRRLIAKSMYNSLQNTAQLTHMLGADARGLQEVRRKAKKAFEEGRIDVKITVNDLVCYAVVRTLLKFPEVNSHCLGDAMRIFRTVHLGVAVDTERGLMVPAIRSAEDLDITGLSRRIKEVAEACRKGSINPDLLSSEAASFTVSNLGGYGVEWFTPIINVPQSAILGVGTLVPRPKDLGGGVYAFVPYLGLSLTYDHRAIDGGLATTFLKAVADEIENIDIPI